MVILVVAHLDNHHHPGGEDQCLETAYRHAMERVAQAVIGQVERGRDHPLHHQPGDEQVQTLEGVKSHPRLIAEAFAGQHHDGRDPAHQRDVTQQLRVAVADPADKVVRVAGGRARARLACAALSAELIHGPDAVSTLYAIRHPILLYDIPMRSVPALQNLFLLLVLCSGAARAAKTLDIYFIDVEGGQSTLLVSPSGQTLLIDTGYADFSGRDADRIAAAAKLAHVKRIDSLFLTHHHADHAGGVANLLQRLPVGTFFDHGPSVET